MILNAIASDYAMLDLNLHLVNELSGCHPRFLLSNLRRRYLLDLDWDWMVLEGIDEVDRACLSVSISQVSVSVEMHSIATGGNRASADF